MTTAIINEAENEHACTVSDIIAVNFFCLVHLLAAGLFIQNDPNKDLKLLAQLLLNE